MRGETGGDGYGGSKALTYFECDKNVEKLNTVFWSLEEMQQNAISGVYLYRMPERRIATIIDVTRHQVRNWLNDGYLAGFKALSTTEKQRYCK